MKILVVYDTYLPEEAFAKAFAGLSKTNVVRFARINELQQKDPVTPSERAIKEYAGDPDELASMLTDEDALVIHAAPVTDAVMKASPNLKAVFCARGGPVNIDVESATKMKIAVVPAPGRNADAVADFALGLILALSRHIFEGYSLLRDPKEFTRESYQALFGHELGGQTLGLVGYGHVGSRVAARALAFGMSVLVYDPYVDLSKVEREGVVVKSLEEVLSAADFVSMHARESPDNADMIGKAQFGIMKRSAYFLNTARGSLVDEKALHEALVSKQIAGAALDVMKVEPIDFASPLLKLENVIATPHIAGASHEVRLRGAEIVGKQVAAWLEGRPLDGVLNPQVLKPPKG